jgi:exonuclease III
MSSGLNSTSVEVVTFNMNGKGMALGEVISAIKKNTELIVICIQEADLNAARYEQQITAFMENYKCKARGEISWPTQQALKLLMFVYQKNDTGEFTFTSDIVKFKVFKHRYLIQLQRPWKGAIIISCTSKDFEYPFIFAGAHLHAGSESIDMKQRKYDIETIKKFIEGKYKHSHWCLFGDLNMRNDANGADEFKACKASFHLYEANFDGMTYKLDPIHRDKFPYKDQNKCSQTDRVCHSSDKNVKIQN